MLLFLTIEEAAGIHKSVISKDSGFKNRKSKHETLWSDIIRKARRGKRVHAINSLVHYCTRYSEYHRLANKSSRSAFILRL